MKHRTARLRHEFVECIPEHPDEGTLYVSVTFATAVHKCCCGCGREVVTPLSPAAWALTFDGETVSLDPSIGNWNLPCRSHYWIRRNRVEWAGRWSPKQISAGRASDARARDMHFSTPETQAVHSVSANAGESRDDKPRENLLRKLTKWCRWK